MAAAWKSAFVTVLPNIHLMQCHAAELWNAAATTNGATAWQNTQSSAKMLTIQVCPTLPCATRVSPCPLESATLQG